MVENKFTYKDGAAVYLYAILGCIGFQILLTLVLWTFGLTWILEIDWVNLLVSMLLEGVYVAIVVVYCKVKRTRFDLGLSSVKPTGYVLPVVTAFVCFLCFYLTALSFDMLLKLMSYQSPGGISLESLPAKIIGIFVTVICAPIGEELVFRGALLSGLKERFKPVTAALLSGLAFSLMHMNPEQTVYQFLLGVACAWLALKSGSVLPAMVVHGISNLIACLIEIITPLNIWLDGVLTALVSIPWLFVILTILLFAAGAVAVFFLGKFMEKFRREKKERNFTSRPPTLAVDGEEPVSKPEDKNVLKSMGLKPTTIYVIAIIASAVMWLSVFVVALLPEVGSV